MGAISDQQVEHVRHLVESAGNCPGAGWQFYEEDFLERIRAAQRMGRTVPDASGWALGYERPVSGVIRVWRGVNCHPGPPG